MEFGRPGIYLSSDGQDTILAICCEHITEIRSEAGSVISLEVGITYVDQIEGRLCKAASSPSRKSLNTKTNTDLEFTKELQAFKKASSLHIRPRNSGSPGPGS